MTRKGGTMDTKTRGIVGTTAAAALLVPGIALATTPDTGNPEVQWTSVEATAQAESLQAVQSATVCVPVVEGQFSFDQTTVTPIDQIAGIFQKAPSTLCGASTEMTVAAPDDWTITVSGDVANAYSATIGEIKADDGEQTTIMGCACAGNPAGGRAIVSAEVTGIPLAEIIYRAQPSDDVNTVTLVSEDGYRMSIPLDYVLARRALMVSTVNGADLGESMGGTNQVWMDAAAAKYFSRNVVAIELTCEEQPPAAPGTEEAPDTEYANRPNAGIMAAAQG